MPTEYQYNSVTNQYISTFDMSSAITFYNSSTTTYGKLGIDSILAICSILKNTYPNEIKDINDLFVVNANSSDVQLTLTGEKYFIRYINKFSNSSFNENTKYFKNGNTLEDNSVNNTNNSGLYSTFLHYFSFNKSAVLIDAYGYFTNDGILAYQNMLAAAGIPLSNFDKFGFIEGNSIHPILDNKKSMDREALKSSADNFQLSVDREVNNNFIKGPALDSNGGLTLKSIAAILIKFWNSVFIKDMEVKLPTSQLKKLKQSGFLKEVIFTDIVDWDNYQLTARGTDIRDYFMGNKIINPNKEEKALSILRGELYKYDKEAFETAVSIVVFDSLALDRLFEDSMYMEGEKELYSTFKGNDGRARRAIHQKSKDSSSKNDTYDPDNEATFPLMFIDKLHYIQQSNLSHKDKKLKHKPIDGDKLARVPFYPASNPDELDSLDKVCESQHNAYSYENNVFSNLFGFFFGWQSKHLYEALRNSFNSLLENYKEMPTNNIFDPYNLNKVKNDFFIIKKEDMLESYSFLPDEYRILVPKVTLTNFLGYQSYELLRKDYGILIDNIIKDRECIILSNIKHHVNNFNFHIPYYDVKDAIPLAFINALGFEKTRREGVIDNMNGEGIVFEKISPTSKLINKYSNNPAKENSNPKYYTHIDGIYYNNEYVSTKVAQKLRNNPPLKNSDKAFTLDSCVQVPIINPCINTNRYTVNFINGSEIKETVPCKITTPITPECWYENLNR